MALNLSNADIEAIQRAFQNALRAQPVRVVGGGGGPTQTPANQPASTGGGILNNAFNTASNAIRGGATAVADSMQDTSDALKNGTETFNNMSKTGNNFSNDVIGMAAAAAKSRMDFNDFSQLIAEQGQNFAGLGGSVTRGSEAFGKLSNEMFQTGIGPNLAQMGYSVNEINELLAMQATQSRYMAVTDDAARMRTLESTHAFAKELDLAAKLSGKSRQALTEDLKQQEVKTKLEARYRTIERTQGADAARAARENFAKMYEQIAAVSQDGANMFKESFVTGGVLITEASRNTAVMSGEAGELWMKAAVNLSKGVTDGAGQILDTANAAAVKMSDSADRQNMVMFSEVMGPLGQSAVTLQGQVQAASDAVHNLAQASGKPLQSTEDYQKAMATIREDLQASQAGFSQATNGAREKLGGFTEGVVATDQALRGFKAQVAEGLTTRPEGGKSAADVARSAGEFTASHMPSQETLNTYIAQPISNLSNSVITGSSSIVSAISTAAGDASKAYGEIVKAIEAVGGRESGSLGTTGKLFEDFGAGTLTVLHGQETVMTPEQLSQFVTNAKNSAVDNLATVFSGIATNLPKDATSAAMAAVTPESMVNNVNLSINNQTTVDDKSTTTVTKPIEIDTIVKDGFNNVASGIKEIVTAIGTIKPTPVDQSKVNKDIKAAASATTQPTVVNNKPEIEKQKEAELALTKEKNAKILAEQKKSNAAIKEESSKAQTAMNGVTVKVGEHYKKQIEDANKQTQPKFNIGDIASDIGNFFGEAFGTVNEKSAKAAAAIKESHQKVNTEVGKTKIDSSSITDNIGNFFGDMFGTVNEKAANAAAKIKETNEKAKSDLNIPLPNIASQISPMFDSISNNFISFKNDTIKSEEDKNSTLQTIQQNLNNKVIEDTNKLKDISFGGLTSNFTTAITTELSTAKDKELSLTKDKNAELSSMQENLNNKVLEHANSIKEFSFGDITGKISEFLDPVQSTINDSVSKTTIKIGEDYKNKVEQVDKDTSSFPSFNEVGSAISNVFGGIFGNVEKKASASSVMITDSYGQISDAAAKMLPQGKLMADIRAKEAAAANTTKPKPEDKKISTAEINDNKKSSPNNTSIAKSYLDTIWPKEVATAQTKATEDAKKNETPSTPAAESKTEPKPSADVKTTQAIDNMNIEIVKRLDTMNKNLALLIAQHDSLGRKQIRETRKNNQNLYEQ